MRQWAVEGADQLRSTQREQEGVQDLEVGMSPWIGGEVRKGYSAGKLAGEVDPGAGVDEGN